MASDTAPSYEWGKTLNFTVRGTAMPYCQSGWGEPEVGLIWTDGLNATLAFLAKPPSQDVHLALSCSPFLAEGKVPFQELHLFINFLRVGFSVIRRPTEIEWKIPKHVFGTPHVQIDLYVPKACSPAMLRLGPDLRELGLAVERLTLTQG